MKILFISNYRDGTGWSIFGQNQILALDAAGVDVVPRSITFNNSNQPIHKRLSELEKNSDKNPTHVIFNTLPTLFQHTNKAKTIGYYLVETDNFRATNWQTYINMLDNAWVPCNHNLSASLRSFVKTPVDVVPMATDFSKFTQKYEPITIRKSFLGDFIFYYIGELSTRKNVEAILKAFHLEFSPSEPVQMLLKLTPTGLGNNPNDTINNFLGNIKKGLRLYNDINAYKKELIICGYTSDIDIQRIHSSCDCLVNVSHGEAWNIPAFDAMGHGKMPIVGQHSGFLQWGTYETVRFVESYDEPVFNANDAALPDIYTSNENWYGCHIKDLMYKMRMAFEQRDYDKTGILEASLSHAQTFSYKNVGKLMKENLEGENNG